MRSSLWAALPEGVVAEGLSFPAPEDDTDVTVAVRVEATAQGACIASKR